MKSQIALAVVFVAQGCGGSVAIDGTARGDAAAAPDDPIDAGTFDSSLSWIDVSPASSEDVIFGGGTSSNDIWTVSNLGGGVAAHRWNGSSWRSMSVGGGTFGVVVVAGDSGDILLGLQADGRLEHWDGSSLTVWRPYVGEGLRYAPGLFIAPGEYWIGGGHTLGVERWRDGALIGSFDIGGSPSSMAGSGSETYALVPITGGYALSKWDGTGSWRTSPAPFDSPMLAMSRSARWVTGDKGVVWYRTGDSDWSRRNAPTTESLRAIDDDVPSDVWAVGTHGIVLRYVRGAWNRVEVPGLTQDLNAVWTVGADLWIAGQGGVVVKAPAFGG